jgi:drug/metabolite transporter (DMT)-like permease
VLLAPIAVRRGALVEVFRRWRWLLVFTVIEVTAPWWLLTTAEEHLSSALAGLLLAATPLFGVLMSRLTPQPERLDTTRLAGLLVGVVGVGALLGLQLGHVDLLAVGAALLTALGYATGPLVLSHRLADLPGVGVVFASLLLSAVAWAPAAIVTWPAHIPLHAGLSVVALALVCTAVAFLVFFALIGEVGPARATVITYVNPAVAIALGVVVLGERFTVGMAVGFPLVLLGSILATRRPAAVGTTTPGPVAAAAGPGVGSSG